MYINFKQIDQIENILNSITTSNIDVDNIKDLNENQRTYLRNEVISYMDKILKLN
tara:strand:+ start:287 stop:451 length:165 start_codon:yes stop_codon:yes gene_type:complete